MRNPLPCLALIPLLAVACERSELPASCPELAAGDLAFSELRGPQTDGDTLGQWVELYNASDRPIDLGGIALRMQQLDGTEPVRILVRQEGLVVDPGAYVVLGVDTRCSSGECIVRLPPGADYGFGQDFTQDLYVEAILELEACGEVIDRVVYGKDDRPPQGTLSLDGRVTPDAATNDKMDGLPWCFDLAPADLDGGPVVELGLPGSPGEANRECL